MRKKKKKESRGAPAWMATFSDLMTLLLTFFILLYSISTVDQNKFVDVANGLRDILTNSSKSVIDLGENAEINVPEDEADDELEEEIDEMTEEEKMQQLKSIIEEYATAQGLTDSIEVNINEIGVQIDIKDKLLFEVGKSDLKDEAFGILNKLGQKFNELPNDIMVEGHTDNVPINTSQFESNWELSASRAINVVRYLAEKQGVDPKRMKAVGHGEYSPKVPNTSAENRQLNRRVNIVVQYIDGEKD
ncbi:OmpA family protein [Clostridium sediminicola]|uniref:flagellar motor protein MotB n=1 Tax=Clostridium sediminicola TaxID=3114879 RepID=UPI0031F254C8